MQTLKKQLIAPRATSHVTVTLILVNQFLGFSMPFTEFEQRSGTRTSDGPKAFRLGFTQAKELKLVCLERLTHILFEAIFVVPSATLPAKCRTTRLEIR